MDFEKSQFHETYIRAAGAVAYVAVVDSKGDEGIGSCFHIGNGIFVTARHVVEGLTIKEVPTTKSAYPKEQANSDAIAPRRLTIVEGPHFGPENIDVAVFRVDVGNTPLPAISVSQHTEYDLEEHDLVLADILILGYPPIPYTTIPVQVATLGQINAVVRVRHSPASHFIASTMARGGFSGGVALDRSGIALALVTESLGTDKSLVETGYNSLLSITPAVDLAAEKYGFSLSYGVPGRYSEALVAMRFSKHETTSLSSYVYDAHIYVMDDNRDVFVEMACNDDGVLQAALDAFAAIVSPRVHKRETGLVWFTPADNPAPAKLIAAADSARAQFLASRYLEVATEHSNWQLDTWRGD